MERQLSSMEEATELGSTKIEADLTAIATTIRTIAQHYQGHSMELLAVLRLLEHLHREIRDSFFQESLPDNRQALYALLRDVELSGGWPYIHRMKLQTFLANLPIEPKNTWHENDEIGYPSESEQGNR